MSRYDFTSHRLFVEGDLGPGRVVAATPEQANYLCNVLRLKDGDHVLLFNGRDGEWRAALGARSKRGVALNIEAATREQEGGPDIDYLFAPLKRSRLDYMVQKATEMGVARLRPVITRRTVAERVNVERLAANAIEAAEQCGILRVPSVAEPEKLATVLARWPAERTLVFCDEDAEVGDPVSALSGIPAPGGSLPPPLGLLIGPEGGFDPEERARLLAVPGVVRLSLGPRILRADTAAVAALALVNACVGDWR
ncbi:MAG: 16S rRNA (uracil(1498)-N(3))-methyltransferase [Hyphomicrobiaceae bacterium]|nr:16S rRNA (uracil(1498)-N(3))-methyltransferase [Hyphomicrobiaceae bacterium]